MVSTTPPLAWQRWLPGLVTLRNYQPAWFANDLVAGPVLSAILVPVGMGYAEASGLPAIYGLYATIVPLLAYAVFGLSRILVLGPDSTLATSVSAAYDLAGAAQVPVVGALPHGLPALAIPHVAFSDVMQLMPGAVMISLLSFADTSVLSRSQAQRAGYQVSQNQEIQSLPSAALGAVVEAACLSFADLRGMWAMWRLRRVEFALSEVSFLGVAFVGVIEGIKGFHDFSRHPEGRFVPGLVLFRWDAPLFFANAEVFREQVQSAIALAPGPVRRVVVAADAITDVDITATDTLTTLYRELAQQGIELWFAGLKGPIKDRLRHYGTLAVIGEDIFAPTVGRAVHLYREKYPVDWRDWDEA